MIRTFSDVREWGEAALEAGLRVEWDHGDYPGEGDPLACAIAHDKHATMDGDGFTPERGIFCPANSRWPNSPAIGWLADTADEFHQFQETL